MERVVFIKIREITLLKSILKSLRAYFLSLFVIPSSMTKKNGKSLKKFLMGEEEREDESSVCGMGGLM